MINMGFIVFIIGLAIGSFLNAYIWRSRESANPRENLMNRESARINVWKGRSHCPKCNKILQWYELIPLVSFFIQYGKCRGCKQKIDSQYPLVEVGTGLLFILGFWALNIENLLKIENWELGIDTIVSWYLLAVLVILFVYDLRYGLVPDRVVLPAIAIAFVSQLIKQPTLTALSSMLLAIVVGAAFFAIQYYLSRGRWLGLGDIRIGALMGAMLGWPLIIEGLIISYITGGAVALVLLALGKKKFGQTLPLGTFLTAGTVIVFLYGTQIWNWYWF